MAGSSSGALALRNVAQKSIPFSASMVETRARVLSLHRDFLRSVPWIKRTYKVPMAEEVRPRPSQPAGARLSLRAAPGPRGTRVPTRRRKCGAC